MLKSMFNILAICGSAGFAGVMLCIGVTLGGYWRSLPSSDFLSWFAANNHFISNTIPIIVAPTLIGLVGSIWIAWGTPNASLWIASGVCMAIVIILTGAYFVPANSAFAGGAMPVDEVAGKLAQWIKVHYARIAFAMIAAALGVIAVAK
ncbi:hypothetical protein RA27_19290 [Ruegeria sp. ANG-R]|uniref:anthrone oxygenase family protein n=1 Tax=Ruegeria sp. ANG-R TaxID=1577903 RepID=UPI00057E19B3|nr:DUF1772 domain-containing protein [Ruegeria sp. ANG-R]KIC38579.1 hypothetical protein RA27_19290 [Ruegeria sp. ANG-R]